MGIPPDNKGKKYKVVMQDPRVTLFKAYYTDPKSDTFCNVRGSGIKAGYTESYSENITNNKPGWWVEFIETGEKRRAEMLEQSEKNLQRVLKLIPGDKDQEKLQVQVSQFVSERVGKEFYSTRQEVTGADGKRLFTNEQRATAELPVSQLFKGVAKPQ